MILGNNNKQLRMFFNSSKLSNKITASFLSIVFVSIFYSLITFPNLQIVKYHFLPLIFLSFIITFYVHEAGHYIWGYLTGGKVEFFCNQNNLYIARIRKYTKISLIAFSLGGPLSNLMFGIFSLLILLLNINLLIGEIAYVFSFLNLVCGIGALIPISSKRGGLLYYNYISNS